MPLGADAIVQSNTGSFVGTSGSATLGVGTTAGNTLVVVVGAGATSTIGVTGLTGDGPTSAGNARGGVFRKAAVAAETSWTVTAAISGPVAWAAYEIAGIDPDLPVDVKPSNFATYTSAATWDTFGSGTNPTSTTYDGLVIAVHTAYIATTSPPTISGHTQGFVEQHQVQSVAGAASITMSCSMLFTQQLLAPEPAVTRSDGAVGNGGATHVVYTAQGAKRAPDLALCFGAEIGTAAGLNTGIAGGPPVDAMAGSPAITSSTPRSGGYCLELSSSAAAENVQWTNGESLSLVPPGSFQRLVVRVSVRFPSSLPSGDVDLLAVGSGASSAVSCVMLRYRTASTKLGLTVIGAAGSGTEQLSATVVAADTWYDLDLRMDQLATTWAADWRLAGVDQAQATKSGEAASQTPGIVVLGWTGSTTATVRYDDLAVSKVAGHYPLGDLRVVPLKADPAGTLTISGTAGNFNTFTSNGTMAAWNAAAALAAIDDIPPTVGASADGLAQVTLAASDYVEIPMETYDAAIGNASVRAARMYACGWAASTTAATIGFRSFDGTTEHVLFAAADPEFDNSTTDPAWVCRMAGRTSASTPAPTWTKAKLDALTFRVGFSGDATPDIGIHAILAEAVIQPGDSQRVAEVTGLEGVTAAATVDAVLDPVTGGPIAYTASAAPDFDAVASYTIRGTPTSTNIPAGTNDLEIVDAADATEVTSVSIGPA